MKPTNALASFAFFLASLFVAQHAAAQGTSYVSISNEAGEAREVCVYRADDPTTADPIECFELYNKQAAKWYRQGDRSNFRIRTFDPTSDDKVLDDRELPGGTTLILLRKDGKLVFGGDPRKKSLVVKFRLKACNQRFDEKISFALSFENDAAFISEGWWSVEKGKCVEIPVSEKLKQSINLVYGELPRAYFYARTHGKNPRFWYWSGAGEGKSFCINEKKAFKISGKRNPAGTPSPCTASYQKTAAFRRVADPKADEEVYYLNF
jgi:uncharacterized membrane protein